MIHKRKSHQLFHIRKYKRGVLLLCQNNNDSALARLVFKSEDESQVKKVADRYYFIEANIYVHTYTSMKILSEAEGSPLCSIRPSVSPVSLCQLVVRID